jgi:predicted Fe-Mo cluster-binding NifX family protein
MRVVVSAQGDTLDAPASPVFGRCPTYVFVDSETMEFEAVPNPAMNQGEGAGIQAAQFVLNRGAEALLTGNLGPNAFAVLQAAGVPGYLVPEGTVRQAVEALNVGKLRPLGDANVAAKAGAAGGVVPGTGSGWGRGMGRGRGRGRGMGMGGGFLATPPPPTAEASPASEAAELRETIKSLRQQLAKTMERLEELEKKG